MASLSLGKMTWQAQLGVFVVLSLALCGAFYYQIEEPQQAAIAVKEQQLSDINVRIERGREMARKLPEFRTEIGQLESQLASLRMKLPEEKDVADLLRRIQTLATQSNLTIRGFKPQAIKAHELHAEWPIGLELEGTYHNLGLFLDRVSKFPRIINVGSIGIKGRTQPGPGSTIEVSCIATTFVLVEPPADSTDPKGAPGAKPAAKTE